MLRRGQRGCAFADASARRAGAGAGTRACVKTRVLIPKFKIYDGTYLCLLSNYSEGGISKAVEAGDGEAIIFLQSGHGTASSAGHAPGDTSIPALARSAPAAGNLPGLPSLIVENCMPLLALTLLLASFQALVWDE